MPDSETSHGTRTGYQKRRCRCVACSKWESDRGRARRARATDEQKARRAEMRATWMDANPDRLKEYSDRQRAARRSAPLAASKPRKVGPHGTPARYNLGCKCPECRAAHAGAMRTYWATYAPSVRGKAMAAARNAKRRARRRGTDHGCVSAASLDELYAVAGGSCVYCGSEAQHFDHIHPLDAGGPHCLTNLAPACASCNLSKGAKVLDTPPEPLMRCESYVLTA